MTAPVVRVSNFLREGTGWLGDPPEVHSITITDVGGQYDWFCTLTSCLFISEGLPSGDAHPSPDAAERDAIQSHAEEGVPLDTRSLTHKRMAPSGWDERPF